MRFVETSPNGLPAREFLCTAGGGCDRPVVKLIVDDDGYWGGDATCDDESHAALAARLVADRESQS